MSTAERLRADIDRGRTGDKVPFSDPAAAPLGTDDEAAGTPPGAREIALARAQETGGDPDRAPGATGEDRRPYNDEAADSMPGEMPTTRPPVPRSRTRRSIAILIGAAVVMGALLTLWATLVA
ncbi:hypothetical protein MKI84_15120 [Ancylobacter sp. A5.8]|uniref:hypothetical protein n=1 Tax=Ancylobacter gelatini TaxID=2919920 RepID=UPI001F4E49C3|nr:hypothetical protein [Ancylobacter gelatini]MCJ8144252.1 hypothetical protein [Ancylobacter gelatini]